MIIRMEVSNVGLSTMRVTSSALYVGIPVQYTIIISILKKTLYFSLQWMRLKQGTVLHYMT